MEPPRLTVGLAGPPVRELNAALDEVRRRPQRLRRLDEECAVKLALPPSAHATSHTQAVAAGFEFVVTQLFEPTGRGGDPIGQRSPVCGE
jgi:hypothetical protein